MRKAENKVHKTKGLYTVAVTMSIVFLISTFARAQDYSNFTIDLGTPSLIPNASGGIPIYPWFPDGHITMLPDGDTFQMYWAGSTSYRSVGPTIDSQTRNPSTGYALTAGPSNSDFDNGGAWLMSVFRHDGDHLIGFYHGEDHYWPPDYSNPGNIAWKSIAFCESTDNGITWTKLGQILTTPKWPFAPKWGGPGDACVVYDEDNARWVAFFQEGNQLLTAISTNEIPGPGTWLKYYNGSFSQPGLNGSASPVPGLQNHAGANPSVHFNTHIKKWVMVWHTWASTGIWLSVSDDLLNWNTPINVVSTSSGQRNWYPTIIGKTDVLGGEYANLYWAKWPNASDWPRQFLGASIRFRLPDTDGDNIPDAWEQHHWPGVPVALVFPDADLDGDGQSNLDEYLADTDPTNSASYFHITEVHSSVSNETVLAWQSSEYKYYGIEMSTNLSTNTSWTAISSNIRATPPLNTVTNIIEQPGAVYRIRLEQD